MSAISRWLRSECDDTTSLIARELLRWRLLRPIQKQSQQPFELRLIPSTLPFLITNKRRNSFWLLRMAVVASSFIKRRKLAIEQPRAL
jgi:hypothetical protein